MILDKEKPCGIVLGMENETGLQTARLLAWRGVPVVGVVKDPTTWACRTNTPRRIIRTDIDAGNDAMTRALVEFGSTLTRKAVLFPAWDETVHIISRDRAVLAPYFHIAVPPHDMLEMLTDKSLFHRHAQKNGFLVPRTFHISSREDAEKILDEARFPCILKPSVKTAVWLESYFGIKAHRISTRDEFLGIYDQCRDMAENFIVQEWVSGGDDSLYSFIGYFDARSKPLATFVSKKLRQWPPGIGNTSLGQECRDDVVLREGLRLFTGVPGFHGLGYLEMKRDDRTGEYFVIEANIGRGTGRSMLAEDCGVELLLTKYCDKAGLPLPENRTQRHTGRKWIQTVSDIRASFYMWKWGELTIPEWIRSIRGSKTHAIFSWRDPMPALAYVFGKVILLLRKILNGKFRIHMNLMRGMNLTHDDGKVPS
ncbi:MAG: carboxylate--amine ligase [Candidatus Hydrogenedentota bacterium]